MDEFLASFVRFVSVRGRNGEDLFFRPEEGDEVDRLVRTTFGEGCDEDSSVDGIEGELSHLGTEWSDLALL